MTRTIADLTDDEIVDAIASFGVEGFDADNDAEIDALVIRLGYQPDAALRPGIRDRLWTVPDNSGIDRLCSIGKGILGVIALSAQEWSRRLANRSAEDIAHMLAGES